VILSALQTLRRVYFSREYLAFKHLELTDASVTKTDSVCWSFLYFNLEFIRT